MGDRNRKTKRKEHEIDGPSHGTNRSTAARVSGAYGGGDVGGSGSAGASGPLPIQDNPGGHGQNAPRSALVADQSLGRMTGRQPGVELGASAPLHGLHLQGNTQGSGNRPPTPKVCPDCHNSVFSNNIICVHCACEAAQKVFRSPRTPCPPLQRQQRPPHGLQGANLEFVADRPTGQQRGGAPGGSPAIENSRRGLMVPPQENPEPRAGESSSSTRRRGTHEMQPKPTPKTKTYACPACHVNTCSSNRVVCQPCATARAADPATGQQQLLDMADLTADICPVGERSGALGGRSNDQLGHPGLQRLPQEHPVSRADKPVGFHRDPVVIGPGPALEDGWCPACRFYPARTVLQPRRHDCLCYTCLNVDRMVCAVCATA